MVKKEFKTYKMKRKIMDKVERVLSDAEYSVLENHFHHTLDTEGYYGRPYDDYDDFNDDF